MLSKVSSLSEFVKMGAVNLKHKKSRKAKKRGGRKKKCVCFRSAVKQIRKYIHERKPKDLKETISAAIKVAKKFRSKIKPTRIIQVPKTGGILPLIPIFAGLSALGALTGGAAGVYKAVTDAKTGKQQLEEAKRHNLAMESVAMSSGKGLYLKPYKNGYGLFL